MANISAPDAGPFTLWLSTVVSNAHRAFPKLAKHRLFRRYYLVGAIIVLFGSAAYWSVLGAKLQVHNADQLSDPYLFSNWKTFHGAVFPSSHSFLLKWPIFWLVSLCGVSAFGLTAATMLVVMATLAVLTYILYKIERRPLVLGTLLLALALALMLVPAQPYAGGLLPVNMAMLTTRNLEYAVYLISMYWFVRASRIRSRYFYGAVGLLSILIASDKLFLSLSLGGALITILVYASVRSWGLVNFAVRWLAGSVMAAIGSSIVLFGIAALHITHFSGAGASPYALVTGARPVVLGVVYGVLGLFTNFGANPVYDNRVLRQLPSAGMHRLISVSGLAHLVAGVLFVYGLVLAVKLVGRSLQVPAGRPPKDSLAVRYSLSLVASSCAAGVVFIVTNHYYAVDARYLTISFFAVVVSAATILRKRRWQRPERLVGLGLLIAATIVVAGFSAHGSTQSQQAALTTIDARNHVVSQALHHHHVSVLVGDYWRVLPIKYDTHGSLNTLPLGSCTQPTTLLTSSNWQPNLRTHSFAYLVSLDSSLTGFPHCNLADITAAYGKPNANQVIAGTPSNPQELLLFYDHGSHPASPAVAHQAAAAIKTPPLLSQLTAEAYCSKPTTMNVVAHEDDDLLFLSPDLLHDLHSGRCVRTVYLTAGDNGSDKFYWLNRQQGSEAAYSKMLGKKLTWNQQTVEVTNHEFITISSPKEYANISLMFFNIPDGGLTGQGFPSSNNQSLAKLQNGELDAVDTIDGLSHYTAAQLITALSMLMSLYQPAVIHTQANVVSADYPDHSDHMSVGQFAQKAATLYDTQHFGGAITVPVAYYIGYPIHGYPANVSGDDLSQKEAAFLAYAHYDGGVCQSLDECQAMPTYGSYLTRQYQNGQ